MPKPHKLHGHCLRGALPAQRFSGLPATSGISHLSNGASLFRSLLGPPTLGPTGSRSGKLCNAKTSTYLEQSNYSAQSCSAAIWPDNRTVCAIEHGALAKETVNYVESSLLRISLGLLVPPIRLRDVVEHGPHGQASGAPGSKRLSGLPASSKSTGHNALKPSPPNRTQSRQENKFQLGVYDSNDKLKRAMLGCWINKAKAGQSQLACDGPKHHWKLVRSLCRSRHLGEHAAKGDITDLQLRHLKAEANQGTREGDEDELRQEELWRDYLIYLYPAYSGVRGQLNPYVGQPLLTPGAHTHVSDASLWPVANGVPQDTHSQLPGSEGAIWGHHSAGAALSAAHTATPTENAESSQITSSPNAVVNAPFALPLPTFPTFLARVDEQAEYHASNDSLWQVIEASDSYGHNTIRQPRSSTVTPCDPNTPVYSWRASNLVPGTDSSPTTIATPSLTNGTEPGLPAWENTALTTQSSQEEALVTPLQEATLVGIERGYIDDMSSSDPSEMATEIADLADSVTLEEASTGNATISDGPKRCQPPFAFVRLQDIEGANAGYY